VETTKGELREGQSNNPTLGQMETLTRIDLNIMDGLSKAVSHSSIQAEATVFICPTLPKVHGVGEKDALPVITGSIL
jgi:hypothetical protein